ncbi:MAG: PAS domain S-box protein, partial [Deltaproteobacteria bacterium]
GGGGARVVMVTRDITPQARLQNELAASERRFRALVENAPEAIVLLDVESGRFVDCNDNASALFGLPVDELLKVGPVDMSPPVQPDGRPSDATAAEYIMQAVDGSTPVFEWMHRDAAGRDIPCEVRLCRFPATDGLVLRGSITDIRERKRLERELAAHRDRLEAMVRERTAELERAIDELEGFAHAVAHDLRTPLRAIAGFADALVEDEPLSAAGADHVARIRRATERAGEIVDALLGLARVSHRPLDVRAVDASQMAFDVVAELRVHYRDRAADVHIQPAMCVVADPALLRIALANVVDNAFKFTRGTATARIEIGMRRQPDVVELYVRDNGVGFDMQYAHALFGTFGRLHGARDYDGTGLGLVTAQRAIARMGGTIRAEGEPGRGATFWIALPARAGDVTAASGAQGAPRS